MNCPRKALRNGTRILGLPLFVLLLGSSTVQGQIGPGGVNGGGDGLPGGVGGGNPNVPGVAVLQPDFKLEPPIQFQMPPMPPSQFQMPPMPPMLPAQKPNFWEWDMLKLFAILAVGRAVSSLSFRKAKSPPQAGPAAATPEDGTPRFVCSETGTILDRKPQKNDGFE
jgi:hypothetical protein